MSKTKWHTRALYMVFALALVAGLTLVPAAQPPEVEADPAEAEVVLKSVGEGEACWSSCYPCAGSDWSVKLFAPVFGGPDSGDYGKIILKGLEGMAFEDLEDFSFLVEGIDLTVPMPSSMDLPLHQIELAGISQDITVNGGEDGDGAETIPACAYRINIAYQPGDDSALSTDATAGCQKFGTHSDADIKDPDTDDFWAIFWDEDGDGKFEKSNYYFDWAEIHSLFDDKATVKDVRVELRWPPTADSTVFVDDIMINGDTYELEADEPLTLIPKLAYNVKTADETFVVGDQDGNPICPDQVYVDAWHVSKGCGVGDVTIVKQNKDGPSDGDDFITVRMVTAGDALVTAEGWLDMDCDANEDPNAYEELDDRLFDISGEKKWGEIYCTKLEREAGCEDEYVLTETVTALFWWHECTDKVQHVADDAKVDWWLMDIDAQGAIEALEAELGDDPCDEDGGCGAYPPPGWLFEYDLDGDGTIDPDEKFDSPREALEAMYANAKYKLSGTEDDTNYIGAPDVTQVTTFSGVDGTTAVTVHTEAPTSVILVTLTDYPRDKGGQNKVCVQHEKWVVIPPPPLEKLIDIAWKGEKEVVEANFGVDYAGYLVKFLREHGGPGAFVSYGSETDFVYTQVGCDGVARAMYLSDVQGQVDIDAELYALTVEGVDYDGLIVVPTGDLPAEIAWTSPFDERGIILLYLELDEIELVNIEKAGLTSDKAWTLAGATSSSLYIDESAYLRARVTGWFEDENGDRWVLPDDYAEVASRIHHDVMDSPIDNIVGVNELETATNKLGEFGPYYDITKHLADPTKPCELVAEDPVIGPFSKCEPWTETGWDVDNQPAVVADETVATPDDVWDPCTLDCRTTVVPDGKLDEFDATMPPAEIIFVVNSGKGILSDVDKGNIYVKKCTSTEHGTLNVYPNPYYKQEIPAHWLIDPMYGSGSPGYEWDSWGWEAIAAIDGPYDFYDEREVWDADYLTINLNFDLGVTRPKNHALKVYSDNRGEAWVYFTQMSFDRSTIVAVADYPYLVGKNPPIISNEVIKIGEDLKDVELYVDDVIDPVTAEIDPIRKMVYVFVRDYDGTPAECEKVGWIIDGPYGLIEGLLEGTDETCANACYPVDYWDCEDAIIAGDGRSAASCTREMDEDEIAEFVAEAVFADEATGDDYAIAGVVILSSHLEDVDVSIKIHDCWDGDIVMWPEDIMVEFGNVVPEEDILDYYRGLDGDDTDVSTSDLLAAIGDWASETIPSGFTAALTTIELLTLISEWAS